MRYAGSIFIAVMLAVVAPFANAQSIGEDSNRNVSYSTAEAFARAPFAEGEKLTYEAKINKVLRGIPVADLSFSVEDAASPELFSVFARAESKGALLWLFRYSFLQEYRSSIDPVRLRALKTSKHDVQKERVRDGEATFDYGERRVTYVESDPKEPLKAPRRIASGISDRTQDLISSVYSLRAAPLAVGKKFTFSVSDSGLVYEVPVKVTAREQQKTIFGKVWCFRVEPQVFGPGRMIEQEGSMVIWITDSSRRIPVRAQVKSPIGRVEIKLKAAENLK